MTTEVISKYGNVQITPTFFKNTSNQSVQLYSRDMVTVDFDPVGYARKSSKRFNQEEIIESVWKAKIETNPRIYNASKFRLADASFTQDSKYQLKVGLTDYKELLGTHYCERTKELVEEAKSLLESNPEESDRTFNEYVFMGNAIGVGAIAVTRDDFVILMMRSQWTGESCGKLDRPGGHPEPVEALKESGTELADKDSPETSLAKLKLLTNKDILEEIFESPRKELRDEINVELEAQEDSKLLGRILDQEHGGRVGLDFLIQVKLTKEEIVKRYSMGLHVEAYESTGLVFVPVSDVEKWQIQESLLSKMTGHCLGGMKMFHLYLSANKKDTTDM